MVSALERNRFHRQMGERTVADGTEIVFAGVGLDERDQFLDVVDAEALVDDERARLCHQHGNERKVLCRIVGKFAEQDGVDGQRPGRC